MSRLTADGLMVDVGHDGADGLWLAKSNQYDVVVLDITLVPDQDSIQADSRGAGYRLAPDEARPTHCLRALNMRDSGYQRYILDEPARYACWYG